MADLKRGLFSLFQTPEVAAPEPLPNPTTSPRQKDMRLRLAEFENARVSDVMIPRAEIVGVELSSSLDELIQLYAEETHSRLPVYRETLDDPVGLVHIKDVVSEIARQRQGKTDADSVVSLNGHDFSRDDQSSNEAADIPLERLRRDILFVPASMRVTELLVKMQTSRLHMALVVDEYGGTDGLVSLEDLVEQIVGEIEDEHDDDAVPMLLRRGRLAWEVDARMETEDFEEETGLDLTLEDHEVDTLGGIAFALAGRVPLRGEVLPHPSGPDLEIMDADPRRIHRLIVRTVSKERPNE